jgi:hypothetical protein
LTLDVADVSRTGRNELKTSVRSPVFW